MLKYKNIKVGDSVTVVSQTLSEKKAKRHSCNAVVVALYARYALCKTEYGYMATISRIIPHTQKEAEEIAEFNDMWLEMRRQQAS